MHLHHLHHRPHQGWDRPLPRAEDGPSTLVLAFAAPALRDRPGPLDELRAAFPRSVLCGCSTSGEIAAREVHDASLSVAVARFEHVRLRLATVDIGDADGHVAGAQLGAALAAPQDGQALRAVFVLSDGLVVNGTALVTGLASTLPAGVPVSGGLAGDGADFRRTWVLVDGRPRSGAVCAVGLYGERLRLGHGCDAGWSGFGPQRRITRSEGNVLYELDGRPALDLYKAYLGDRASELPGAALRFPLAVRRHESDPEPRVRTILAIDEEQRSMTFAGDLPRGGVAQLMRTHADKLIGSAGSAAQQAATALPDAQAPTLVVSVSCVGRRLVLGERTDEEVETVADSAPPQATHVGFYSYGEISPATSGGVSGLHNQTMTVTMFGEA